MIRNSHFLIPVNLIMKVRLSAKLFIWKLILFAKPVFIVTALHLYPRFHNEVLFEVVYLLNTLYLLVQLDCELFVPPVDAPLFVADMTKPGKIPFREDMCSDELTVQRWSYRMTDLHWHTGLPNNFRTEPSLKDVNSWSLLVRII